ncbi:hypothetical protein [Lacticaseibacillus hulanensis]|uniref:hypothetical protein n=1 Tax=Lacticaseibacillus hulanensis TaxID=2493111 RepID=UPI000FD87FB2|nr:hypothetical protein [Lacticaseibacillus hulanensis]
MDPKIIFIVCLIIIILVIIAGIRLVERRRETRWLDSTNKLVKPVLKELGLNPVNGHPVDKVWGRNLALTNFRVPVKGDLTVEQVRTAFSQIPRDLLELTDVWIRNGELNVDVTLMVNMSTRGYVNDLRKLN